MNLAEIKEKKRSGDLVTASEIVGITPANIRQALQRENSKHHDAACAALGKVIKTREELLTTKGPSNE
jgi:hypothetical protein